MAEDKIVVKSLKTGLEQTLTKKELKAIDPNGLKFVTVRESATPPEAKAADTKKVTATATDKKD